MRFYQVNIMQTNYMVTILENLAEVQFTQGFPNVPYLQNRDENSDLCSLNLSIWFTVPFWPEQSF